MVHPHGPPAMTGALRAKDIGAADMKSGCPRSHTTNTEHSKQHKLADPVEREAENRKFGLWAPLRLTSVLFFTPGAVLINTQDSGVLELPALSWRSQVKSKPPLIILLPTAENYLASWERANHYSI